MPDLSKIDRIASRVLTAAVLVATAVLVEGRINQRSPNPGPPDRIELVKNWRDRAQVSSVKLGSADAPIQVVVFTDFSCPFCFRLDSAIQVMETQNPSVISRSVVHFPVSTRAYARNAALAFGCAHVQNRAKEMSQQLYQARQVLSSEPWDTLARAAGVQDSSAFNTCITDERFASRVDSGLSWGETLKLAGTPAVIINGWLIEPATPARVSAAIDALRNGRDPED
jgi:protein-disulfide isomerase